MNNRTVVKLSQCTPGTAVRLFAKYRDKSPRPRFKFAQWFLGQHEMRVVEHMPGYTRVAFMHHNEEVTIPLSGDMRIAL